MCRTDKWVPNESIVKEKMTKRDNDWANQVLTREISLYSKSTLHARTYKSRYVPTQHWPPPFSAPPPPPPGLTRSLSLHSPLCVHPSMSLLLALSLLISAPPPPSSSLSSFLFTFASVHWSVGECVTIAKRIRDVACGRRCGVPWHGWLPESHNG